MNVTSGTSASSTAMSGADRLQREGESTMTRLLTTPTRLLRLESAALLAVSLLLYWKIGGNWLAFALLLLVPDASMVGYLRGDESEQRSTTSFISISGRRSWRSSGILMSNEVTLSLALSGSTSAWTAAWVMA